MWIEVVAGVAVLGIAILVYVYIDRKRFKGISMFQRHAITTRGVVGEATILDRVEVSVKVIGGSGRILFHLGDLVLDVRTGDQPLYRAPCRQEFIASQWMDMRTGAVVPVRIDPEDPQKVLVDTDARVRADADAERGDREEHARRQSELLGRK